MEYEILMTAAGKCRFMRHGGGWIRYMTCRPVREEKYPVRVQSET